MNFWVFFGILQLIILTYQDIRHKKIVDDRHNWFMYGTTAALYALYVPKWYIIILIVVIAFSLGFVLKRLKAIGAADSNTIVWIFTGFSIINITYLILFLLIFIVCYLFQAAVNQALYRFVLKQKPQNFPAYPLFLIVFAVTNLIIFLIN